jgi:Family of unknown function (DUF6624)
MMLVFALALGLGLPLPSHRRQPTDPLLAAAIQRLFHATLTGDDGTESVSEAIRIYRRKGLPTITEVGNEDAYEFVVVLASQKVPIDLRRQILSTAQRAGARHEVPADAATFYAARLRVEELQEKAKASPPTNPNLRDEIERMYQADQAVRQSRRFDAQKMEETDKQHSAPLRAILDAYGVPTYSMVGPVAAGEFLTMVQHQPAPFREKALPELMAEVEAGQADPESYALVYDRSRRDLGEKQLYGEQLECTPGGQMHEAPIADEAHVNQRRAKLGLIRVELYARLVVQMEPQFCGSVGPTK